MNLSPDQEASRLLSLTGNGYLKAMEILEKQLNVLHLRAQVLMSLAGIVITVTGFSGRSIAGTSFVAQVLVISGLATVLVSAIWVFSRVMTIKWLTTETAETPEIILQEIIKRRNRKTRAYVVGGRILCLGLLFYSIAFSIMLLNPK